MLVSKEIRQSGRIITPSRGTITRLSQKVSRESLEKTLEINGQIPSNTELVIKRLDKQYFEIFVVEESDFLKVG